MMIAVSSSPRSTGAGSGASSVHSDSGPRVHTGSPRSSAAFVAAAVASCQATTSATSASSRT